MGAEELVKHLTECRNVAAAVVYDGDATAVVQQMLADGWTYQGEETVEGKRLRYLVPPPELAERLSGATENPDHRPLPHGGYACTKWGCTEHQNAESHYGVRGSQTIGEHEATRDDPECRYPNGVCTCSGSPHSAAEARVCACPPSICYSGEARALDLPCRANAEPTEHPMRPCDCDECRVKLAAIEANRLVPPVGRPHRCAVCGGWFATQHAVRAHHHPAPQPAEQLDPASLLYELDAGPEYGHCDGCVWPHKICTGHQTAAPQRLACGGCSFATADPDRMDGHLNATGHGAPSQPTYGVLDNGCGSHGYRLTDGCPECALRKHRIALTTSPEGAAARERERREAAGPVPWERDTGKSRYGAGGCRDHSDHGDCDIMCPPHPCRVIFTTTDRDHALHVQNRDPVSWCRQCTDNADYGVIRGDLSDDQRDAANEAYSRDDGTYVPSAHSDGPNHRPLPSGGYACTTWGCTEHNGGQDAGPA